MIPTNRDAACPDVSSAVEFVFALCANRIGTTLEAA
jgi:hypothetical protein